MPDVLVFSTILHKLIGTKIIIDIQDLMPELYMTKYSAERSSLYVRMLTFLESLAISYSDIALTANESFRDLLVDRHREDKNKISIINNYPVMSHYKQKPNNTKGKLFHMMYMGTIDERFGIKLIIQAMMRLSVTHPTIRLTLIPRMEFEGFYSSDMMTKITRWGLKDKIIIEKPYAHENLPDILAYADLGLVPLKRSIFTELIVPVKLLEFLMAQVPVITVRTKTLSKILTDNEVYFIDKDSPESMYQAICYLYNNSKAREKLKKNGYRYMKEKSWEKEKNVYFSVIEKLLGTS